MLQHHISCCSDVFCAAALCFVPWPVSLCHDHFLFPWHCATCCGIVLCAAALFFVPWQCSLCCGKAVAFVALFFMLWQEMTCHSIAWHSMPSFLHASAKKNPLLHSMAGCVIPWHCSSCCGHISLCHDTLKHSMLLFFVLQQEMK